MHNSLIFIHGLPLKKPYKEGFTLIEISIVLVIIGLIVGGVLVGRDLITASAIRSQLTQIEKYNSAVNTFKGKYGDLPGDLTAPAAAQYGFMPRAGTSGRGDGNGAIEGYHYGNGNTYGWGNEGETLFFWRDISQAGLIPESFSTVTDASPIPIAATGLPLYMPPAKIRTGAYVYVFSTCQSGGGGCYYIPHNYFGLTSIASINGNAGLVSPDNGLTVMEAYKMDIKVDDGIPNQGRVQVMYPYASSALNPNYGLSNPIASSTTCFDTTTNQYSITQNNGSGLNCGLSFQFQ